VVAVAAAAVVTRAPLVSLGPARRCHSAVAAVADVPAIPSLVPVQRPLGAAAIRLLAPALGLLVVAAIQLLVLAGQALVAAAIQLPVLAQRRLVAAPTRRADAELPRPVAGPIPLRPEALAERAAAVVAGAAAWPSMRSQAMDSSTHSARRQEKTC
jgi:hypothetical protein